uniref:Uncharacterized protein n=1 Tax=Schistocephalus solidus TaxID=70667 RepID=A0A0X3P9X1_SCHSO
MTETQPKEEKLSDLEKDLRSHPAFAKSLEDMQDSPAFQALQALKYESENPNENAQSYKEEGNYYVERGEFGKAVTAYGGGIAAQPTDKKLLAVLYTNRGIAQARMSWSLLLLSLTSVLRELWFLRAGLQVCYQM